MPNPLILPLETCTDRRLVGGKAAGLGKLIRAGFHVPPGICVTTAAYRTGLLHSGLDPFKEWNEAAHADASRRAEILLHCQSCILEGGLPSELAVLITTELARLDIISSDLWAVRSSGTYEDAAHASFAGIYSSSLGVSEPDLATAIAECWASLWTARAFDYHLKMGHVSAVPEMAVIVQRMINPQASGVGFSINPRTGRDEIVINAVLGIAEPLVSGRATPDEYVVRLGAEPGEHRIIERRVPEKRSAVYLSAACLTDVPVKAEDLRKPALTDAQVLSLSILIRKVHDAFEQAVDAEWALDNELWLLQARPVSSGLKTAAVRPAELSEAACTWSRTNFKETLPELPSPLALSFVREFMEVNIVRHYRELGCRIPPGLSSVRIFGGRPYINMTLLQSVIAQLGGDPAKAIEQMGGEAGGTLPDIRRLAWPRLLRALLRMEWRIVHAGFAAPSRFAELKRLATHQQDAAVESASVQELADRLDSAYSRLQQLDLTFAIVSGVSQALYALATVLQRRVTQDWRPLLNAATQGLGTIISARQINWLEELAERARREPPVREFLEVTAGPPEGFRDLLAGTRFLQEFDAFLIEYGHRAVGESDVMSARFAESPGYLLDIIRRLTLRPSVPERDSRTVHVRQARESALIQIRHIFGRHRLEWLWFQWWHRVLCRYLTLREENRHALMHYVGTARHILLLIGRKLALRDVLAHETDVFFLTPGEIRELVDGADTQPRPDHWKRTVAARRAERDRQATLSVPHTIWGTAASPARVDDLAAHETPSGARVLVGLPISSGVAQGSVRIVRSPADLAQIRPGEILVAPVIDPGMAPVFGLAAGVIVEMGGLLSHGAIIVREYGLPAVANVDRATRILQNGERITLDADRGEIRRQG